MFPPAILVVFILSPNPAEPTTPSFQNAATEVLGPTAAVRVESVTEPLPDEGALARAGAADGVVEITWDSMRQSVTLHCYLASQTRWVDRIIHFGGDDRDAERGRLLGFVVASMFSDAPNFAQARAARQEPPLPGDTGVVVPAAPARDLDPSAESPAPRLPAPPPSGHAAPLHSLELAGVAAPGFGGATNPELGARVALRLALAPPLWLRFGLGGRLGEIPAAQANVRRLVAGLGMGWDALPRSSSVELSLWADALGGLLQVAHLSSDDVQRVHRERWFLGADAQIAVGYRFTPSAVAYCGLGLEATFGRTHVYTHGEEVATVPIGRALAEVGLRADF